MTMTNGRWIGHAGYAGQYLLADPLSGGGGVAIAFFSVLETSDGEDGPPYTYFSEIPRMATEVFDLLAAAEEEENDDGNDATEDRNANGRSSSSSSSNGDTW